MQQHAGQRVTVALAAGEHADGLEHIVFREEKTAEQAAQLGLGGAWRSCKKIVEQAGLRVQSLVLVLGKVIDISVVSEAKLATRGRLQSGQQLDQGRLARAVHADESDA